MLKMGILGMGKMGELHAKWINANENLKLVAICDKDILRLELYKKKYAVPAFTDVNEFLSQDDIDFVVIVTTNEVHEKLTVMTLKAGKNVIVEKPMSLTYQSTQRMIKEAEKAGKILFVHHSSRWDRDFLLVKETIQSGLLGEILQIHSKVMLCDEGWPSWGIEGLKNPWRVKKEYGGGMLLDWGPHLVDQLLILIGKQPIGLFGSLQNGLWADEVDDHFFSIIHFEGNLTCQIECSNNGRIALPRWYIIGTKGTLEVQGEKEPFWGKVKINYLTPDGKSESRMIVLHDICESGTEGGFYEDLAPFVKGEISQFVSMYEASNVIKVLEAIKTSHDTKKYIHLN
jgi:scyllo-inositol 2-dehydrogenase (NADP+)